MLLRIRQDTTKPLDHPYRVPLPRWGLVAEDPVTATMIVEVPEEDLPPEFMQSENVAILDTYRGPVLHSVATAALVNVWYEHLVARYQEHAGEFLPVLAPVHGQPEPLNASRQRG